MRIVNLYVFCNGHKLIDGVVVLCNCEAPRSARHVSGSRKPVSAIHTPFEEAAH